MYFSHPWGCYLLRPVRYIFASMCLCPLCRNTYEYIVLHSVCTSFRQCYQASKGQEVLKKANFIQLTTVCKIAWTREVGFTRILLINNMSARACDYTKGLTCCRFCSVLWLSMPRLSPWLIVLEETIAEYQEFGVSSKLLLLRDCCSHLRTSIEAVSKWSFCNSAPEPITLPFAKVDSFVLFGPWASHDGAQHELRFNSVCGDVFLQRSPLQLTLCDAREHKTNSSRASVWVSERWLMECTACCFIRTESRTWAKLQAIHLTQTVLY